LRRDTGIVNIVRPIINPTVDALAAIGAKAVIPAHCTGWCAAHALARAMRLSQGHIHPDFMCRR
jgi:metal-dependent hydrolase (beta-lactamase superfamily II)